MTGGAYFLDSHIIKILLERGDEVVCTDNFSTGTKYNIEHLTSHPRFEFLRHDVTFPLHIEADKIYNLTFPASPIHYQYDPAQTTKTSVHGAINMLGLAKRLRARIFRASTSKIYGNLSVHLQPESYWSNVNSIGPEAVITKANDMQNFYFLIITDNITSTSVSLRSSILMVLACTLTTAVQ